MKFSVLAALVLPGMFVIGAQWGTAGVASAWIVGYPLVSMLYFRKVFEIVQMRVREYLKVLWPPIFGTLVMAAAVLAVQYFTPADWPRAGRLGLQVLAGVLTYAAVMYGAFAPRIREIMKLMRSVRT